MLIFALVSVPILLFYLNEKLDFRKIVIFFIGMLFSQFISILMWSISTLYTLESDFILLKTLKYCIIDLFPIITLFLVVIIIKMNKKSKIIIRENFIYGFLYWNMIFGLFYKHNFGYSLDILLFPIIVMILVYSYHYIMSLVQKNRGVFLFKIMPIIIPLILLLSFVLMEVSYIFVIISIFIQLALLFLLKRNNNFE